MEDDIPNRKLLTRKEAAVYITTNYFKISARTLAIYASDDVGPPYRILGGAAHYAKTDIDAWVNKAAHAGNVAPTEPVTPSTRSGALSR